MKADTLNLAKLFGADVQYVVPMFQRPYVWEKEKQWEPLWQDLLDVVDALLHAYATHKDTASAEEVVSPHFLGAVVLDPLPTGAGQVDSRHVIDGQQRLTSLQLLIAAFYTVAADYPELARHERVFHKLIRNDQDLIDGKKPEQQFKIWPTRFDRGSFEGAMTGKANSAGNPAEAYEYFVAVCREWAKQGAEDGKLVEQFDALQVAVRSFLKLVAIDLEGNDNAQAIFEVLNARGTELLAVDLIKNLAFREAEEKKEDVDKLYHTYWQKFDSDEWRVEEVVGRLKKARADQFLTYWLVMKTARDVHAQQLFPTFRNLLRQNGGSVQALIADLSTHADEFDKFRNYPANSPEGTFFYRVSQIDINAFMPLALFLFGMSPETLPVEKRRWALAALESWLVRRALIRASTKDYNKVVPLLISRVQENPHAAAEIIVQSLQRFEGPNRSWPSDEEVRTRLRVDPIYNTLKRSRLRMVLEAIENYWRGSRAEELIPSNKLHIEHILPQEWTTHWPIGPVALGAERDVVKHRLGNLTLLTQQLNLEQSNSAWLTKRAHLHQHSVLLLNRKICELGQWDEEAIKARGDSLIDAVLAIWKGPDADIWMPAGGADIGESTP